MRAARTCGPVAAALAFVLCCAKSSPVIAADTPSPFAIDNGDTNGDWEIDLSDGVYLLGYLFLGGPPPARIDCGELTAATANGDINGDGSLDLSDGIGLFRWLFTGGPAPVPVMCGLGSDGGAGGTVQRSISDFVEAQGTFCFDDGMGGCFLFVPPIENFLGQSDPAANLCSSVDYAGLANAWIESASGGTVSFGTEMAGSVTERVLADGRAEVHVRLHTTNALTWVIDGCEDFATNPLLFGHRAPDVLAGAEPALGSSLWNISFINTAPGAPLPDLLQLLAAPEPGQEPRYLSIYGRAHGTLREAFGVPDGTPGFFETSQTGLLMTAFQGATADAFPVEKIHLKVVGQ